MVESQTIRKEKVLLAHPLFLTKKPTREYIIIYDADTS